MKKLLLVLTFVFVTLTCLVAAANDTLNITVRSPEIPPTFRMKGGFAQNACNTTATLLGAPLETADNFDFSATDVVVWIRIEQIDKAKYTQSFDLTVTATALSTTIDGETFSVVPTAANTTNINTTNLNVTGSVSNLVNTAKAIFSLEYTNGKPVQANTFIGDACFTWAHDEDLPAGEYTASITLSYTAP